MAYKCRAMDEGQMQLGCKNSNLEYRLVTSVEGGSKIYSSWMGKTGSTRLVDLFSVHTHTLYSEYTAEESHALSTSGFYTI